jgi:hypothetical protein
MNLTPSLTPTQERQTARLWAIVQTCLRGYGHEELVRLDTGVVWFRDNTVRPPALHARLYRHPPTEHLAVWVGTKTGASTSWDPVDLYVCFGRDPWALRHAVTGAPPPPWVMRYLEPLCAQAPGGDLPPPRNPPETQETR